jgi:transposase
MNKADRITIVQLYYKNGENCAEALRKFCTLRNIKRKHDAPNISSVQRLIKKFNEHGFVSDISKNGRPGISEDDNQLVTDIFDVFKEQSQLPTTRNIANELKISNSTVWKILKLHLKLFPYKIQVAQLLTADHSEKRVQFCTKFLQNFCSQDERYQQIIFSDEAFFSLHGLVN